MFGQIESIIKIKTHNLLLKLTGYSLDWIYISQFSRALQRARHCTLHLKCLRLHSLRYAWHMFREPSVQIYRGWLKDSTISPSVFDKGNNGLCIIPALQ